MKFKATKHRYLQCVSIPHGVSFVINCYTTTLGPLMCANSSV